MQKLFYDQENNVFVGEYDNGNILLPQIVWHITEKCILSCPFCFAKKNGNELTMGQLKKNVSLLKKLNVIKIDISGGEPLLHKDLKIIVNTLFNEGFNLTITTSGSIKNSNTSWIYNNLNKFVRVIVSLDAYGIIHDNIRGMEGLFQLTNEFIESITRIDSNKLRINTVISEQLLSNNNFKEIYDYIENISPKEWCLIEEHPANKNLLENNKHNKLYIKSLPYEVKLSDTKVIYRKQEEYSDYWVLDADNTICKHSDTAEPEIVLNLDKVSVDEIINQIKIRRVGIPMNDEVKLINCEKSTVVADVLEQVKQIAIERESLLDVENETIQGAKGEILIGILIGISTNTIYDVLKYCVNKVASKRKISDEEVISINGEIKKINDFK